MMFANKHICDIQRNDSVNISSAVIDKQPLRLDVENVFLVPKKQREEEIMENP